MIVREKLIKHFQEEYGRLNTGQRQAVDRIEGPVMVIAGPGTGKTQILAARIGKILLDTDTSPSNILCLTYTDAGALAMRRRLLQFIGSDAHKVHIFTFHAFCNEVIQDNLSLFNRNELEPVSDLEKIDMLQQLIDTFPVGHPLKRMRGDIYYDAGRLERLFSVMKREGWTSELILKSIDQYLSDLPNRDGFIAKRASGIFKKGDIRTDKIEEQRVEMEKLAAAVREFDRFQEMMAERNRYDFDDMLLWVVRAFKENQQLLLSYQERFQYILVDEYQDTSGTQNQLVRLLISFWEQPNIFVVGDDDQSIYRFQGANVENMEQFCSDFATDLFTVVLTNNYRSTQPILDISKTLISRNQERLIAKMEGLTKDLIASHPEISLLDHEPLILEYESELHEMAGITLRIEQLLAEQVAPGKIAVIYKENKYGDELKEIFRQRNIPAYSKRSLNLFDIPVAAKIISILEYLDAELDTPYGGDEMLFRILHFDFFGIAPMEIAKLTIEVSEKKYSHQNTSIRRLLHEKSHQQPKDLFDKGIPEPMRQASLILERLIADVPNHTLQSLVEKTIRTTGLLGNIMQAPDKLWQIQVITSLFDFVREETRRNPDLNLHQLIMQIRLMKDSDIRIPIVQIGGTEKGVNLLTAHGSKGLEFEYVFVAGSCSKLWEGKKKINSHFKLPDTLFVSLPTASQEEETRRLFYVALTRAQKQLFITFSCSDSKGKGMEKSKFIDEIRDFHDLPVQHDNLTSEQIAEFQALKFLETAAPELAQLEKDFISRLLDRFVMNVTALNNYLQCPIGFYFKNLIRIPSPKNEATEFGSSVHYALQKLFEKMKEHPLNEFPSSKEMIADFEQYMHRHRESFTKEAFERRMIYGQEIIPAYYDRYINEWNKIVAVELNVRNVVIEGVPLKGKLDKLEFNQKEVNVVDYKTGNPENAKKKLVAPSEKDPNGGDYWRQAVFYKILVDNMPSRDWKVTSTEFDFIEPDNKKQIRKEKIIIRPEDITTVKRQIVDTWNRIQAHDFYTGCGKTDCEYCNFVKSNHLYTDLHASADDEEEELQLNTDRR